MENILVAGANTRAVTCSVKKLGYKVYSADYFGAMDLRKCAHKYKSFLDQIPRKSCGNFTKDFKSTVIEEMALEMIDNVEGIICCAGVSPHKFPKDKIIGNVAVGRVTDKYLLMEKLGTHFNVPETYLLKDEDHITQLVTSAPHDHPVGKKFILKPRYGTGGYGVRMIDFSNIDKYQEMISAISPEIEKGNWLLQEFIEGENLSASVLSTNNDSLTITTSSQIIGDPVLGQMEPFGYCGNIVPFKGHENISEIAQNVVSHLSLIGSNGVDFIIKNGEPYVIEVNPRLQGTFECAEEALQINMAEAHIAACQGQLKPISPPEKFAVKMVVYAHKRCQVGNLDFLGVHDIPNQGVIIEKGEPVATVLTSSKNKKDAIYKARYLVQKVYNQLSYF